jgi:hypothetical protein
MASRELGVPRRAEPPHCAGVSIRPHRAAPQGKRMSERAPMWIPTTDLPVSPGHPFPTRRRGGRREGVGEWFGEALGKRFLDTTARNEPTSDNISYIAQDNRVHAGRGTRRAGHDGKAGR